MSHLLHVAGITSAALQRQDVAPVMSAFPVAPECAPFLVTSSSALVWIPQAFVEGTGPGVTHYVKATFRSKVPDLGTFYREVADEVRKTSLAHGWGSVQKGTAEGIKAAIEYVKSYGLDKVEILAPPKSGLTPKTFGMDIRAAPWLSPDCYIVVPVDRRDLGFVSPAGPGTIISVIHNASRGMAFAWSGA